MNGFDTTATLWQWLARHEGHPLAILMTHPESRLFSLPGIDGGIACFEYRKWVIVIGGLLCGDEDKTVLLGTFLKRLKDAGKTPLFLFFREADGMYLQHAGMSVNQIGASCGLDLSSFHMNGRAFQQLRYKIRKAERANIEVMEITDGRAHAAVSPRLQQINDNWLEGKGKRMLQRLVTDFDSIRVPDEHRRLFVAMQEGEAIAYILYSRVFGSHPGWFHDLSRREQSAPDGIMQLINRQAIATFQEEGCRYLNFGFTPLVEMGRGEFSSSSSLFGRIAAWLAARDGVVYPAGSQWQYKKSWRPHRLEAEYMAFPRGKTLSALWGLLKASNSI